MVKSALGFTIIYFLVSWHNLAAQEKILPDSLILLKNELRSLQLRYNSDILRIDSLLNNLENSIKTKDQVDDFQKLLDEANQLAAKEKEEKSDLSKKFHSGVRQQQGLNPNISLGGDFFGAISSSKHDFISDPGDISYGNNGFFPS